jgi:hypothetical protein
MNFRFRDKEHVWVLIAAAVALLPLVIHGRPAPLLPQAVVGALRYAIPLAVAAWLYTRERGAEKTTLFLFLFVCTWVVNSLHFTMVDSLKGNCAYFGYPNVDWQINLQQKVLALSPSVIPHSYRFLPNSLVRLLEWLLGDFASARDCYRDVFMFLVFYAVYKYARLYFDHAVAVLTVAITALITPISFRSYAGQLTDPLSHLSFIAAFYFLGRRRFSHFATAIVIGVLAKETVAALVPLYALFELRNRRAVLQSAILFSVVVAELIAVRVVVLHHALAYQEISGVTVKHLSDNLRNARWIVQSFLTYGVLLPFLILRWRQTPRDCRLLALWLLPVLIVSSFFFSWLSEARNYMPLVFVLAAVAADALVGPPRRGTT